MIRFIDTCASVFWFYRPNNFIPIVMWCKSTEVDQYYLQLAITWYSPVICLQCTTSGDLLCKQQTPNGSRSSRSCECDLYRPRSKICHPFAIRLQRSITIVAAIAWWQRHFHSNLTLTFSHISTIFILFALNTTLTLFSTEFVAINVSVVQKQLNFYLICCFATTDKCMKCYYFVLFTAFFPKQKMIKQEEKKFGNK